MAQPTWITPAGSLGIIPEGIFYQETLRASVTPFSNTPTVTASSSATNRFTCTSLTGIYPQLTVMFVGTCFGGVDAYTRYYVLETFPATNQFVISLSEYDTTPVALTTATGSMTAEFKQYIYYYLIAGALPRGIQVGETGLIVGVPQAVASFQGVPVDVSKDVTSKFVLRAYTEILVDNVYVRDQIRDRTFELTITGNDTPVWTTTAGSIGIYYDGGEVNFQFEYIDLDLADTVVVSLASGLLPEGLTLSTTGLLTGYIEPVLAIGETPGYDLTPAGVEPYDFVTEYQSKNYQFTLEVSDGKSRDVRTFSMFVYARSELTADTTELYADNTQLTADETTYRAPFLTNSIPSNLGDIRSDNYYAYQFLGDDYDTQDISYAISVNQGYGLPPFQNSKTDTSTTNCGLDPESGFLYGYIPDQGTTQIEYSFNITVYQTTPIGSAVSCTITEAGTNKITCASTANFGIGDTLKFSGSVFGGISADANTLYYVFSIIDEYTFKIASSPGATTATTLTTGVGTMSAASVITSRPYPFTMTIVGSIDSEITWLTGSNLGSIINGETSLLYVAAVNRGGRELQYQLSSGAYNSLPQGLELLPTGEIAGRATFNTFAIDLGSTTFDSSTTNWDSLFIFNVNAYAPDSQQQLYNVSSVNVVSGGSGYSSISPPTIIFSTPIGASAVTALAGNVTISGGSITSVEVIENGDGYTGNTVATGGATITITAGFGGTGANLQAVMQTTTTRDVISVVKEFNVTVTREYNAPYQNLYVNALPPENDRQLVASLLSNQNIFIPDYIYRPTDPNFGMSTQVSYQHAFGLAPEALDLYTESLYLNHYWKNLTLGSVETAVARNSAGEIVYEVVYSKIIDNLVNDAGNSVSKIVALPYPIVDPADGSSVLNVVYPNSLINMRDQVIDTVGQISTGLPLWMTSKQADGRVLGFTPAWVIAYVNPNRGAQIAYYLQTEFGQQLNKVDFKVDRYILDQTLSTNWDTVTQDWTPQPSLTTFDRFDTSGYNYIGNVSFATNLAYSDVNERNVDYINGLGGLDGTISAVQPVVTGDTLIFVKQEDYDGPPGSSYSSVTAAWQDYTVVYGDDYDATGTEFDGSYTINDGTSVDCTNTTSGNNTITYVNTTASPVLYPGLPITLSSPIGGLVAGLYVVLTAPTDNTFTATKATTMTTIAVGTDLITVDSVVGFAVNDPVVFSQTTFGGIIDGTIYYIKTISGSQITVSLTSGGAQEPLLSGSGSCIMRGISPVSPTTDSGSMIATPYNERMAIYKITRDSVTDLITLTIVDQTASNEFVQISKGNEYRSAQLYRPASPGDELTRISWLPLTTVVTDETTFDHNSVEFIEPVDMYNPGDINDKYLVFPKSDILV